MKVLTIAGILALLFFVACGEDEPTDEGTPVSFTFAAPSIFQGEEAYTLTVTVTGEGMEEIRAEITFTGKQARIDFPAILSGPNRTFEVKVKDKNGIILYSGSTTQSLTPGRPVTVSIPIVFIKPNEIKSKDGSKMILISAGEFLMGASDEQIPDWERSWFEDEKPQHMVYLYDYYIDEKEVTNEQFANFLNDSAKTQSSEGYSYLRFDEYCLIEKSGGKYRPEPGFEKYPVINVSWFGSRDYAEFYGKRLPTEAEWEKAARGGLVGKKYPWGDEDVLGISYSYPSWGVEDMKRVLKPVGSYLPNGYGLYNMAGNVWEWCTDWYDKNYYANSPQNNPNGPKSGEARVYRGGSWHLTSYWLSCAARLRDLPSFMSNDIGFRNVVRLNEFSGRAVSP